MSALTVFGFVTSGLLIGFLLWLFKRADELEEQQRKMIEELLPRSELHEKRIDTTLESGCGRIVLIVVLLWIFGVLIQGLFIHFGFIAIPGGS